MVQVLVGWSAVLLAVFALLPSSLPGAMSVIGCLISLAALILSVGSVRHHSLSYVHLTLLLVLVGIFVINDGLRLGSPINIPFHFKFSLYGLALIVVVGCLYVAKAIEPTNCLDTLGSSKPSLLLLL